MILTRSKAAALLIGLAYMATAGITKMPFEIGAPLLIPLVVAEFLICFPDALGAYTGASGFRHSDVPFSRRITRPTPGCAVAGLGWVILLGIPVYLALRHPAE